MIPENDMQRQLGTYRPEEPLQRPRPYKPFAYSTRDLLLSIGIGLAMTGLAAYVFNALEK